MENIQNKINAYKELQKVVNKYPNEFKDDYDLDGTSETLQCLEMQQRFGIPLVYHGSNHYRVERAYDDWTHVALYGENNRKIGWLDEGEQPDNEWLYCISFPCGAYIFGDYFKNEYPEKTFNAFFNELKSLGAKYSDTRNSSLYFTEENSKEVYDAFWGIFKKYKSMVTDEMKEQRKKELEAELAKLNKE